MKIKLKHKLIFGYTTLILILIVILAVTSSNVFIKNFNEYVNHNREKEIEYILNQVTTIFVVEEEPSYEDFYDLGVAALDKGLILMVNIDLSNQLICMSDVFPNESSEMLLKMEETLESVYPHFQGEYKEEQYVIENDGVYYGYVTIAYYGPLYYTEFDALFLKAVKNTILLTGLIFFIISGVVVYFLATKLSEPISKVSKRAEEIGMGNYKESIKIQSSTEEIQNLINSINTLGKNLDNQQQIKKQMSVNYTHELRTPITCVLTTIEGMKDGVFEITDERLESLYSEVERISKMVAGVDKLVETSVDEIVLQKENFDIKCLIENCVNSFESLYENKNIKLVFKKSEITDCTINADKEKIKSLVGNLLSNAFKYTDNSGKVEITLEAIKNKFIIKVLDNGIGIEEEEQELIFEQLYRVEKSRVREVEGFGIGLSICKNIVLAHKGTISVKSKLGVGSEFIVEIPKGEIV